MTITIEYAPAISGLTPLTAQLYTDGGGDVAAVETVALTEDTDRDGYYRGTAGQAGTFWVRVLNDAEPFDSMWAVLPASGSVVLEASRSDALPKTLDPAERVSIGTAVWASTTRTLSSFGTLVADVATAVWAAASRTLTAFGFAVALTPAERATLRTTLTGVIITMRGPVSLDDDDTPVITLVKGDDYSNDDARSIELDLDGTVLPDLSGATVALHLKSGRCCVVVVTGEATVETGDTRTVRFEPTADETGDLFSPTVEGTFAVVITIDDRTITPLEAMGKLIVKSPIVAC